jgi:sulfur-oxidizing protein SoxZ
MDRRRRTLNWVGAHWFGLTAMLGAGAPVLAWAQRAGFSDTRVQDVLASAGILAPQPTDSIQFEAPEFADNAAVVPFMVHSRIPQTRQIWLILDHNPFPLIAHARFHAGAIPHLGLRSRLAESSPARVVVETHAGLQLMTKRFIRTTAGGCAVDDAQLPIYPEPPVATRMRASRLESVIEVRALLSHPMENGLRRTANGMQIPARHVDRVELRVAERVVLEVYLGRSVSTNPLLTFRLAGAQRGDILKCSWQDTGGASREDELELLV